VVTVRESNGHIYIIDSYLFVVEGVEDCLVVMERSLSPRHLAVLVDNQAFTTICGLSCRRELLLRVSV
jgi:hypothetical protein